VDQLHFALSHVVQPLLDLVVDLLEFIVLFTVFALRLLCLIVRALFFFFLCRFFFLASNRDLFFDLNFLAIAELYFDFLFHHDILIFVLI